MRAWPVLATFVILAWPGVHAAHASDAAGHLEIQKGMLAAGENATLPLDPRDEGPFEAGWIFVVYAQVDNATIKINVTSAQGIDSASWDWEPTNATGRTAMLRDSGEHRIDLWNPSSVPASYALYFDMSCSCPGKVINLPGGFVLFNFDLPAAKDFTVRFPTTALWHLRGVAAVHEGAGGSWPEDFRVLSETEQEGKGFLEVAFRTEKEGRHYVLVEALEGVYPDLPVVLTPEVLDESGSAQDAPVPALWLTLLALIWIAARRARLN